MLVQEKVTKENTPSVSRPRLRRGFATVGRGSADGTSVCRSGMRAIPRAHPRAVHAGLVRPPFAAPQRVPGSRAKALPRSCSPGSLSAVASARRKKPAGARAGCARVRCLYMDVLSANLRSALAQSPGRSPATAAARVCSLWLLSLAQARESDWPPGMAVKPHTDVSRFSRYAEDQKKGANSPIKWIPAFAGTTETS